MGGHSEDIFDSDWTDIFSIENFDTETIHKILSEANEETSEIILHSLSTMLETGVIAESDLSAALDRLPPNMRETYFDAAIPWARSMAPRIDENLVNDWTVRGLRGEGSPYASRLTIIRTRWYEDPEIYPLPEPLDEELEFLGGDGPVFDIGDPLPRGEGERGEGTPLARGGEDGDDADEAQPRPPDSAPVSERLRWIQGEIRRKKNQLDRYLAQLQLASVLMAFLFGSATGGEVARNAAIDRLERELREGMRGRIREQLLRDFMTRVRRGDREAIDTLLRRSGALRGKVFKILLKRFHVIGAILAIADLAPILERWAAAWRCRSRLNDLDNLLWRWMHESGEFASPGSPPVNLGPFVDPGQLGLPPGANCEHTVTYIFSWTDTSGNDHESIILGPVELAAPPAGANTDGMPAGGLTHTHVLPQPTLPPNFARGYVIYEFTTSCPGREPLVARLIAVAVHPTGGGTTGAPVPGTGPDGVAPPDSSTPTTPPASTPSPGNSGD